MNILEALKRSQETGERFRRPGWPDGGYISAEFPKAQFVFVADVMAEDWEAVPETISDVAAINHGPVSATNSVEASTEIIVTNLGPAKATVMGEVVLPHETKTIVSLDPEPDIVIEENDP